MSFSGYPKAIEESQSNIEGYDSSIRSTKRSATISDFHGFASGTVDEDDDDDDDDENRLRVLPRLTKVKAFKVTRSRSLNHFSLAPTILRRVGEPEVPQTDSTTNTKEIHKPYIKNTIDDHNAEPPTSDMTSSVDHSLPNYYLNSAPSGINGTLFSSSAPNSTAKEAPTTSNDAKVTKSRNSTVIFTKKRSTDSDFHLNEISPISNEGTSRLMKGVFDKVIKEEDENTQNTMRSTRSHSQSTVLHPSFSGRITKSIFHEELQDTLKKGDVTISKNSSSSSDDKKASPPGSSASSKLKQPFFDRKRSFAVFIVLVGLVLVLLGGFIPAIVVLSRGTKFAVNKYFSNPSNLPLLSELSEKYLPKPPKNRPEAFIPRINSAEGLNDAIKTDKEVLNLMNMVSNVLFHGITYSPRGSLESECGFNRRDAMLDLAKLSTVTTRIRTYGTQCNQTEILLDAIQHMNLNMTIAMGVWIGADNKANKQQMDTMKKIIARLADPLRLINSIYIGNEVLFRQDKSKHELIDYIKDAKDFLKMLHIEDIPVGTAEVGSLIDMELVEVCDVVGANIHPFFGGISVEEAPAWVWQFLNYQLDPMSRPVSTPIVITEVGWPSGGGRYGKAVASKASLQFFISDFLCNFRDRGIEYYFFEAFDEPWKEVFNERDQNWEPQWGVFNADRLNKFPMQNIGCL